MCGRYASARPVRDVAAAFGIDEDDVDATVPPADWNVAPTKPVAVVAVRDGRRVLTGLRWGLVPSWSADPSIGSRLINARIETAADKPAFRDPLRTRRCLLPADGWYEWARRPDGGRQPHFLSPADGGLLAFAGLWAQWADAEGRIVRTVTILTGPAPEELRHVHDRAPVVLPPAEWTDWLDPDRVDAVGLLHPTAAGVVVARPVGDAVGDVRATGPALVEPVDVVEQPSLF